jgi:hypothetical protein
MMRLGRRASLLIALSLLALALASGASAFDDPDGFRGLPWGATEEQMRTDVGGWCEDLSSTARWLGDRYCVVEFQIGGIDGKATYVFRRDKFVRVTLDFKSRDFDQLAAIFVERYGAPTSTTQEPYKTQGGLETTNKDLTWTGPLVRITIHRYGSRITEGWASLATRADSEEAARLRKEQTKGAAKDL